MKVNTFLVVGDVNLLRRVECDTLAESAFAGFGDVVQTKHHILRRNGDRRTVGRVKNVVRTKHQQLCLQNGGVAKRQVNGHLVTVEVGVECRTSKRVQLDSLALNKFRLEGLNTKTVQGRGTVEQNRVSFDDVLKNVPNNRVLAVNYLFG